MTAKYHRVSPQYWMRSKGWDDRLRLLGLYVQTNEHRITEGLYRLPYAYIVGDLDWPLKVVKQKLRELQAAGLVLYDELTDVILLVDALEEFAPTTEKQITGAMKRLRSVPSTPLLAEFIRLATFHSNGLAERIRMEMPNAFESAVDPGLASHSNTQALALSSNSRTEG